MLMTYLFGVGAIAVALGSMLGYYRSYRDGVAGFGLLFTVILLVSCGISETGKL